MAIAVAPSQPKAIYVEIAVRICEALNGDMLGSYVSVDGGVTWTANATSYGADLYRNTLAVSPIDPTFVAGGGFAAYASHDGNATWRSNDPQSLLHVDQHAVAFSADGSVLYVGNDGGVFSGAITGSGTPAWKSLNSTLAITQFYPGFP